jgi:hypothetical protein
MTLEERIGQFKAYTEYPNQDTFVISNQTCQDILKYLTELQKKVGHLNTYELTQGGINEKWLECSECMWSNALLIPRNYCPNCGCRMEGVE